MFKKLTVLMQVAVAVGVLVIAAITWIGQPTKDLRIEMQNGFQAIRDELRDDLGSIKVEMRMLKVEMRTFKIEMREDFNTFKAEVRQDLAEFRSEMEEEHKAIRAEMRDEHDAIRSEMREEHREIRSEMLEMNGRLGRVEGQLETLVEEPG